MKKSQAVLLPQFLKHQRAFPVKPLSIAVAVFSLASCGSKKEDVVFVTDVQDCINKTRMSSEECRAAYENALVESQKTAPKYSRLPECEVEFGRDQCVRDSSSGFFMPLMAGFLVGNMLSQRNRDDGYTYNPAYYYRYPGRDYDKVITADGKVLGPRGNTSYKAQRSVLKPKPATYTTVKRGGFGSSAAAKSSWGGGKAGGSWGA